MLPQIVAPAELVGRLQTALSAAAPFGAAVGACVVVYTDQIGRGRLATITEALGSDGRFAVLVVPKLAGELVALISLGVRGIVLVADIDTALPATVAAACAGQVVVPPGAIRVQPAFTFREKQALGMVVLGLSNAEIARQLYLTESAIKTHLSNAYQKLGVRSRSQATALILDPERGLGTGVLHITPEEERISVQARNRRHGPAGSGR
jgi:DNA-binding NarL/FixJ family response regulator